MGRVVMMGPPNQGSEIADTLRNFLPIAGYWLAGGNLTTHHNTAVTDDIYYDVGVLSQGHQAGFTRCRPCLYKVPVMGALRSSSEKSAMKEHITINTSHTFMIYRRDIHKYILNFLTYGVFHHVQ